MSRKGPKQILNKDLRHWRKNKTESHKLAETHDLYDRQLASRRKSHSQEIELLTKELSVQLSHKPTPTVDDHLKLSKKRHDNARTADRVKAERRFNTICSNNMKGFQKLKIESHLDMPPQMITRITHGVVKKPNKNKKNDTSSRRSSNTSTGTTTTTDDANDDVTEDAAKETMEGDDASNGNSDDSSEENNDEIHDDESHDHWHPGPRRYTLAALNECSDHGVESRRVSTGTINLANILGVSLDGGKRDFEREKKRLRVLSECNDSEDEENHDELAAESSKGDNKTDADDEDTNADK